MSATAISTSTGTETAAVQLRWSTPQQAWVTAGFSCIVLHVLDDNFVQPQPGTSAADHVISGVVTLALLGGAVAACFSVRPGLRSTGALLAGFVGVVGGSEAVYYSVNGGPSGDDYTGFLSVFGGVVLLSVAVPKLWSSRRQDGTRRARHGRRWLTGATTLAITVFLLYPVALGYVFTHVSPAGVPSPGLGVTPEDVSFSTSDGLKLEGWFVPSTNGATVVVCCGRSPQTHAAMLIRNGYGVLLFDRRGEGASEGDPNLLGWVGDRDLRAAVDYLVGRGDVDPSRIGGLGLSVGGEMLIHAAAQSDALAAIVVEGTSGLSARDDLAKGERSEALLGSGALTVAVAAFTGTLPPPSLLSEVPSLAPTAVFFVYAEDGQGGSEEGPNRAMYAAARHPKQLWEVPDSQHIAGITALPREYERRVTGFFDDALLDAA